MSPDITSIRELFAKETGVTVYAEYSKEYPECLCAVVLGDVGPAKMSEAAEALTKAGVQRICANVIEDEFVHMVESEFKCGGFEAAWESSWNYNIATFRNG